MYNISSTVLRLGCIAAICLVSLVIPSILYSHKIPTMPERYGSEIGMLNTLDMMLNDAVREKHAKRGSAVLLDANNGHILAATTVNSKQYAHQVSDMITQAAWEPGSVMKPLLIAAAINEHTVDPVSTIYQDAPLFVGGYRVTNAATFTGTQFNIQDIITYSINTGAVRTLESLSPNNAVDERSRTAWYQYLTDRYRFGKKTGVNTAYENKGYVAPPNVGLDLNVRYTNMAIGQGITVTPLQLASAYAAVLNGGSYYEPSIGRDGNKPTVLKRNVVSAATSSTMRKLLQTAYTKNWPQGLHAGLTIGGKSGTAHIADAGGFYKASIDSGTYIGYISHGSQLFVLLIRLDEPRTDTYASHEAALVWVKYVNTVFDAMASYPQ